MVKTNPHASGMKYFRNGLLGRDFVARKVDPLPFMSNSVIFVLYVDDCLF